MILSFDSVICSFNVSERKIDLSRLPQDVRPSLYRISFEFDDDLITFNASVDIDYSVYKPTNRIILHSNNIKIISLSLGNSNLYVEVESSCVQPNEKLLILSLSRELMINESGTLSILFSGQMSELLNGLYSSTYTTKANETKKIISTHFEPDYARDAFPCFDEPSFKAVFIVKLSYPKYYNSLSNSVAKTTVLVDDKTISVEYKPTVKMSTYLVAFVIHDFDSISSITKSGVKVNVWLPSDMIEHGKFAAEIAPKTIDIYEKLFDIPYPIEKIDLAAIPGFEAGAMENYGLVTFRMTALLVNNKLSTIITKQGVGQTIVHELAHQWFGNLVTMKWWNDIWLNEGFATFMESYVMNIHYPSWRMFDQFAYSLMLPAMTYDQLSTTHPVAMDSDFTENIHLMFDHISYNKVMHTSVINQGATILFMLMNTIGESTFMKCVQIYLKKFAYSNSDSLSLWEIVTNVTENKIFEEMMTAWTLNQGYPIVTIKTTNTTGLYIVSQERMLLTADKNKLNQTAHAYFILSVNISEIYWPIPIDYVTETEPFNSKRVWLTSKSKLFNFTNKDEWVKINHNFGYYYRTHYYKGILEKLSLSLGKNPSIFTSRDKMGLISDTFTNVRMGMVQVSSALNHIEYLPNETDYFVWGEAIHNLKYIYRLVIDIPPVNNKFKSYILKLLKPQYHNFSLEMDQDRFILIRSSNIAFEQTETIWEAKELFKRFLDEKISVESDVLPLLACAYVKNATGEEWQRVFDLYLSSTDPIERQVYRHALSCIENMKIMTSFDPSVIPLQDAIDVILDVGSTHNGDILAWNFVKHNWNIISTKLKETPNSFSYLITGTAGRLKTPEHFEDVKEFFSVNGEEYLMKSINESLEMIGNNIYWIQRNLVDLENWLDTHSN
ncbi:hypothetical protein MXB_3843 [Myxobolus squamalis]|nr:hypothetical protein MXB_3843 [Myxobolus squamalis]